MNKVPIPYYTQLTPETALFAKAVRYFYIATMYYTYLLLFVFGLFGGFIGGLIGIGGGILFVLILPAVLTSLGVLDSEIAQYIVANSLFAIFFSSLTSSISLFKDKNVYPREVLIIGLVSIITATLVLKGFVNTEYYDKAKFNIIVIGLMAFMLYRTLMSARKNDANSFKILNNKQLGTIGLVSGMVAPLSGLGGGIVIIPILNGIHKMQVRFANSISLGVIGITSLWTTILNLFEEPKSQIESYSIGYIVFPVALTLAVGVVIASPFGVKASKKIKPTTINYIFGLFIVISMLRKLWEIFM